MMECCCKSTNKTVMCLGRCYLPKHKCLVKEEVHPGPVPKNKGWQYTARDSPSHQLRCGWRPGHISCPVLRRIAQHNCMKNSCCANSCYQPSCSQPCCSPSYCFEIYPVFEQ